MFFFLYATEKNKKYFLEISDTSQQTDISFGCYFVGNIL